MHLLPPLRQGETKAKEQSEEIRCVQGGDTDKDPELLEVFDLASDSHVPYSTTSKPKMFEVEEDEEMLLDWESKRKRSELLGTYHRNDSTEHCQCGPVISASSTLLELCS